MTVITLLKKLECDIGCDVKINIIPKGLETKQLPALVVTDKIITSNVTDVKIEIHLNQKMYNCSDVSDIVCCINGDYELEDGRIKLAIHNVEGGGLVSFTTTYTGMLRIIIKN